MSPATGAGRNAPGLTGRLAEVVQALSKRERAAFLAHLEGGTSADWLARQMKNAGHPIGATTLKAYRQAAREQEGR